MAPLVSLANYQAVVGSTAHPAAQTFALDAASQAVLNYTDRDFGTSNVTEDRTFKYDGKGILEIDDAVSVTGVLGQAASLTNWMAMREGPASVTAYSYLLLPRMTVPQHNEMAFTTNQDAAGLLYRARAFPYIDVVVSGTWGWPSVPADVQQATVLIAQEYQRAADTGSSGDVQSETVAEVSKSYFEAQFQSQTSAIQGIPQAAADILWPYKRHSL